MKRRIAIAIPASVVSDTPHLREKTSKIGIIGRAAAIFRIDEILIYSDIARTRQDRETELIRIVLSYVETPQYLRKRLFGIDQRLQFAGILPPLRTPHHPLGTRTKPLEIGDYREAVTLSSTSNGTIADIGADKPGTITGRKLPPGKRVTTRIKKADGNIELELLDRGMIHDYWGYVVTAERETLAKILQDSRFDLKIATSRTGSRFMEVVEQIREKWKSANAVLIAFGAPSRGLKEILEEEKSSLSDLVDFVINTVPEQGTETVRTEEAVVASLAALNLFNI